MKSSADFAAAIQKNLKYILLSVILMIIFRQYVVMILVGLLLAVLGITTLQVSRLVPHISIETISGAAIFMGFVWGWKVGLIYGIGVGLIGYVKISLLKHTTLVNALLMGFCGVLGALFGSLGYQFFTAYLFTYFIRAPLGLLIFAMLNPDIFENFMHSVGDGSFSVLITSQLLQVVYMIIKPFV
jgi:hypothetical protein